MDNSVVIKTGKNIYTCGDMFTINHPMEYFDLRDSIQIQILHSLTKNISEAIRSDEGAMIYRFNWTLEGTPYV